MAFQEAAQQQDDVGDGDQAGAQVEFHAGRHRQDDKRHGDQQQGHQIVLPFLGTAGEGRQGQAEGAEQGRNRNQGQQQPDGRPDRRRAETRQASQNEPAGEAHADDIQYGRDYAEEHYRQQLAANDLASFGGAAEQCFQRTAFLLAGANVDGRIKRAGQSPDEQHYGQNFCPGGDTAGAGLAGDVEGFDLEGPDGRGRKAAHDEVLTRDFLAPTA